MKNDKEMEVKNEGPIPTRVLPGFMELLPAEQIVFDRIKTIIEGVYKKYGFVGLDTPVIERAEVLLAKAGGETEKQIYRFTKGDNDLVLRFDLTVPLARYVSEHASDLVFPFRRSHIGKVYRAEKPQRGRYRELYQADIDIIGDGSLSLMNDAELPSVIYDVFNTLNIGTFIIKISNRKLITGLLVSLGIGDLSASVMQTIDKIDKIGKNAVREALKELGIADDAVEGILDFVAISGSTEDVLSALKGLGINNEVFLLGLAELEEVIKHLGTLGVPANCYMIDLTIARGLDYYTGTVYETTLRDHPEIGSICSGGRYDNLAEKYTKRKLPGVGISIGLSRLFFQLQDAGLITIGAATPTKVLVVPLVSDMTVPLQVATVLREADIATEVYFEDKKVANKLAYANKKGIPFVVIVGGDEIAVNAFTVKNMETGGQVSLAIGDIAAHIAKEMK